MMQLLLLLLLLPMLAPAAEFGKTKTPDGVGGVHFASDGRSGGRSVDDDADDVNSPVPAGARREEAIDRSAADADPTSAE